jgi:hypothetical protein
MSVSADGAAAAQSTSATESHLRSCADVEGYHIQALDGEIGHIDEFFSDDENWAIRYLMVDTSNWIGGRTVLVSPNWARRIDWAQRRVHVDMSREQIKSSPEYQQGMAIDRAYEDRLHSHYRQPAYWVL